MTPVVAVCGRSNTGKTTLVVKLIEEFIRRGFSPATVKDYHGSEPMDVPGKDTDRHFKAGASAVILRGPGVAKKFFPAEASEPVPVFIRRHLPEADLVIVEGFKTADLPKVEVARRAMGEKLVLSEDPGLLAVVTDFPVDPELIRFDHHEVEKLADFIEERVCSP